MDSSTTSDIGSAAGIGINALSGNWIGAAIGVVGLGASLFGGVGAASSSKQIASLEQQKAATSMDTASLEERQDQVRQQAMQLSSRRSQMENLRNTQRARAMAIQSGTSQGAQYGSGVAGGVSGTEAQGAYGALGINQSLQQGNQMFSLNQSIDQNKIEIAQLGGQEASVQGTAATYQGIASVGGALTKAGPTIGNIFSGSSANGGNGGFGFGSLLMGGFSPSGYGSK